MTKQHNLFDDEKDESNKLAIEVRNLSYKLKFMPDGQFNENTILQRSQDVRSVADQTTQITDPEAS